MINKDIRETLDELCAESGTIILDNPSFDNSIIGMTEEQRLIYDYESMILEMAKDDNMSEEDAREFIDYNTVRALPYMGSMAPIICYKYPLLID